MEKEKKAREGEPKEKKERKKRETKEKKPYFNKNQLKYEYMGNKEKKPRSPRKKA